MRMEGSRLPKQIFCSEVARGTRRRQGSQTKRYKDSLKNALRACDIPVKGWGHLAADRSAWRLATHNGAQAFEERRLSVTAWHQTPSQERAAGSQQSCCRSLPGVWTRHLRGIGVWSAINGQLTMMVCVSVWETERDWESATVGVCCATAVSQCARAYVCVCVSVSAVWLCGVCQCASCQCAVCVCVCVCVCVWRHCHAWLRTAFSSVNQPQCQSVTQSVSVSVVAAVTVPRSFVKLGLCNSRKLSLWHVSLRPVYYKAGPNHETARNAPLP